MRKQLEIIECVILQICESLWLRFICISLNNSASALVDNGSEGHLNEILVGFENNNCISIMGFENNKCISNVKK